MGFAQAISAGFSNYVNFRDRACRSEYWYWVLFCFLAAIVARIIDHVLGNAGRRAGFSGSSPSYRPSRSRSGGCTIATAPAGRYLLGFVPLIGWIILLIWYVTKGTDGPNRFGPDPLATSAMPASPRGA